MRAVQRGTSWGGLLAGPLAWAVSTQFNYILVPWQCTRAAPIVPAVSLVLAALSLVGGAFSWRAERSGGATFKPDREVETERFVATLGMLAAALFALVILMQGSAGLIIDSCIR